MRVGYCGYYGSVKFGWWDEVQTSAQMVADAFSGNDQNSKQF